MSCAVTIEAAMNRGQRRQRDAKADEAAMDRTPRERRTAPQPRDLTQFAYLSVTGSAEIADRVENPRIWQKRMNEVPTLFSQHRILLTGSSPLLRNSAVPYRIAPVACDGLQPR
jgi:hypothetical protein